MRTKMIFKNAKSALKNTVLTIAPEGKLLKKKYNFETQPLEYILYALLNGNKNEAERKFHCLKMYYDKTYVNYGRGTNLIHKELCRDNDIPAITNIFHAFTKKVMG